MAAQTQAQLQEVVALVKRRAWQVLLPAVLTGSLGIMAASILPRKYEATTRLELVDVKLPLTQAGIDMSSLKNEVWAADIHIKSFERLRRVIERLEWEEFQTLPPEEQRVFLKRVMGNLSVRPLQPRNSTATFLDLAYADTDPQRAAQFLNEVRDVYVTEKVDSVRDQAVEARDQLQGHLEDAQARYYEALTAGQQLQRQYGISATQQAPGGGRQREEDPVVVLLQRSEQEHSVAEAQRAAAEQARDALVAQLEATPEKISDTLVNQGVDLSQQLADIEADIADMRSQQAGLRAIHSRHQRLQSEIEAKERERDQLLGRGTETTADVRLVDNPRRRQLRDDIEQREVEIASLTGQIDALVPRIESLRDDAAERTEIYRQLRAYDDQVNIALATLTQTQGAYQRQRQVVDLLMQPEFSPFEVTEFALPPTKPSSPNVVLVVGAGVAVGLVLGLLTALLAEFGRNAFRGPLDVGRALPVPVLGVVNRIVTSEERRNLAFRRALVGSSTVLLSLAILWITWAYEKRPRMLGPDIVRVLDEVRDSFR